MRDEEEQSGQDPSPLEWSAELDSALLRIPFRPLPAPSSSSSGSGNNQQSSASLPHLYKLIRSQNRSELGLLILDPISCSIYYEGLSHRTLQRRVIQQQQHPLETKDEQESIYTALRQSLQIDLPSTLRRTVRVEQSRFSCSLSLVVKHAVDADQYRFQITFDLDPLDHAAASRVLSSHFTVPLFRLAAFAPPPFNGSGPGLDGDRHILDAGRQARALDAVWRCSLSLVGFPAQANEPLSSGLSLQDAELSTGAKQPSLSPESAADRIFFGPRPRIKTETRSRLNSSPPPVATGQANHAIRSATAVSASAADNPSLPSSSPPPLSLKPDPDPIPDHTQDLSPDVNSNLRPDSSSDSDEEHLLNIKPRGSVPKASTPAPSIVTDPSSPVLSARHKQTRPSTPPPTTQSALPSATLLTPSKSEAKRRKEQERRNEIQAIKASAASSSSNTAETLKRKANESGSTRPARRRSRF